VCSSLNGDAESVGDKNQRHIVVHYENVETGRFKLAGNHYKPKEPLLNLCHLFLESGGLNWVFLTFFTTEIPALKQGSRPRCGRSCDLSRDRTDLLVYAFQC